MPTYRNDRKDRVIIGAMDIPPASEYISYKIYNIENFVEISSWPDVAPEITPAYAPYSLVDDVEGLDSDSAAIVSLSASIDNVIDDVNNIHKIDLSELDADNTHKGTELHDTVGEICLWGDVLYRNPTDEKWYRANSENYTKMPVSAMALEDGLVDEEIDMLQYGYARNDTWSFPLTGEKILYVGNTDGDMTYDAEDLIIGYSQPVGCIIASNIIKFTPSYATVEVV